ncbi:hypothetical protein CMI37_11825 [Candidatus Pacearchaeota archaeon]|nr:hypothetical protein [Candidatus Pacearchaeota archaeon]|tara:strand:- start:43 stop:948 length:906 start_codon:yes stop_codon:yes gene_type:complete
MARNSKPTSSNFDFDVKLEDLFVKNTDGTDTKVVGHKVTRRQDNGKVIGVVGSDYGLVKTNRLTDLAESAFEDKGLTDYNRRAIVARDGSRTYIEYDFKNHTREVKVKGKVGDQVGMRLTLNNSYDGSCRVSFALGALRLVCTNGMTTLDRAHELTRKHTKNVTTEFVKEGLGFALLSFDGEIRKFQTLADKAIDHEQGLTMLSNMAKKSVITEVVRKGIANIWESPSYSEDNERTLWNLNNAATQYLTHEVRSERFEYANAVNKRVLSRLHKAATVESSFDNLLLPINEEIAVTEIAVTA